jgi:hypothetical protein
MHEVTRITAIRADTMPGNTAVHTRAGITGTPEPATITRIITDPCLVRNNASNKTSLLARLARLLLGFVR